MANKISVSFTKMTETKFKTILPDAGTFYWVAKEGNKFDVYMGTHKMNNIDDITVAIESLSATGGEIDNIKKSIGTIKGDENTEGSIKNIVKGSFDNLAQVAKDGKAASVSIADNEENFSDVTDKNLEVIISELVKKVKNAQNANKLIIVDENSDDSSNVSKIVTFYQGEQTEENKIYTLNIIGGMFDVTGDVITIDKDAESGTIPDGLEAGKTYIKLVIGAGNDPVYIPADELVKTLVGGKNNETTVDVNTITNEITVTINDSAIVNKMISDGSISKSKLTQSIQDMLDKADSSVQEVSEGSVDGAVNVDGNSVHVHGLAHVATSGKASDIQYKAATEANEENGIPAKPEISVEQAIAKIEEAIGQGGSVAEQISNAITELTLGTASKKNVEDFDENGSASAVLGTENDTADKATVYGVKAAVESVQCKLVWNEIEDEIVE